MIAIRHRPNLVTPELVAWLRAQVGSYEGSGGQVGRWLVRGDLLPPELHGVAALCPGVLYASVHLQCYQDGRAATPCHADRGYGGFTLSIGATRTLRLHRVPGACDDPDRDVVLIECRSGTVVFMDEEFHEHWHHQIPAEPEVTGERLALVFRTRS